MDWGDGGVREGVLEFPVSSRVAVRGASVRPLELPRVLMGMSDAPASDPRR